MASEYLKWKARDQKKAEPPRELTGSEKLKNWLYYNKLWLIAGALLLWIIGSIVWSALGIGQTKPDYIFAYVGDSALSEADAAALEEYFTALGEDANGDGSVKIELRQYALSPQGDAETSAYYRYAADTTLVADITTGESYFFIMESPERVQKSYEVLALEDGSPAEKKGGFALPLKDSLGLDLYIARRCFYGEMASGHEAEEALWLKIREALG